MRKITMLALVIPILVGCVPPDVSYDVHMTARNAERCLEGETKAQMAVNWWNSEAELDLYYKGCDINPNLPDHVTTYSNGQFIGDPPISYSNGILEIYIVSDIDPESMSLTLGLFGNSNCSHAIVMADNTAWIKDGMIKNGATWYMYAHEIGHFLLGSEHEKNKNNVMYSAGSPNPQITSNQIEDSKWGLDMWNTLCSGDFYTISR